MHSFSSHDGLHRSMTIEDTTEERIEGENLVLNIIKQVE